MWVNAGQDFCLFHAGDTRSRAELVKQLGQEFSGVLSSDDFRRSVGGGSFPRFRSSFVYNGYPVTARALMLGTSKAAL